MASASFAARPGDMVSRMDGEAARIVGSPGCATMISSESPEVEILAIGIHYGIQVHVDVDIAFPDGCSFKIAKYPIDPQWVTTLEPSGASRTSKHQAKKQTTGQIYARYHNMLAEASDYHSSRSPYSSTSPARP